MKKIIFKLFLFIMILIILIGSFTFLIGYGYYSDTLHKKSLDECVDSITEKDNYTPYNKLAKVYVNAVVAVEDHRFYDHGAIDPIGIARAMYTNIRSKEFKEGGSTITQQVSKNIIFNQDRTLIRKLGEAFGAFDLEKYYSKQEILALYVNSSYFGDGYYCIYDASMGYFDKTPDNLNLAEAAMLAGVPNAPSLYAPTVNMSLARKRQSHVLNRMVQYGYISEQEATAAKNEPITIK